LPQYYHEFLIPHEELPKLKQKFYEGASSADSGIDLSIDTRVII